MVDIKHDRVYITRFYIGFQFDTQNLDYKPQCGKFQNFSITQILREINFGDSKSAKSAILTHLEALNFNFWLISAFKRYKNE